MPCGALAARAARAAVDVEVLATHVDVTCTPCGRARVAVLIAGASPGTTEEELRLARGALHATLLDEFAGDGFATLEVDVSAPVPSVPPSVLASAWIAARWRASAVARTPGAPGALVPFALDAYRHAVRAYPWRQRAAMAASIPMLVSDALERATRGERDPVADGVVDRCLPPLASVLPRDAEGAVAEIAAHLGAPPASLLECYEAARLLCIVGRAGPCTAALAVRLFEG